MSLTLNNLKELSLDPDALEVAQVRVITEINQPAEPESY